MCNTLICLKHHSTLCIFSGLCMCIFPDTVQAYQKLFSKLFLNIQGSCGMRVSFECFGYMAHIHVRVPHGYLGLQHSCQDVLLHKPSLLPHKNHQLSQTADLLTKQTLLNIAMCKCTIIFLIARNMSFLCSIASRRDC